MLGVCASAKVLAGTARGRRVGVCGRMPASQTCALTLAVASSSLFRSLPSLRCASSRLLSGNPINNKYTTLLTKWLLVLEKAYVIESFDMLKKKENYLAMNNNYLQRRIYNTETLTRLARFNIGSSLQVYSLSRDYLMYLKGTGIVYS